jgi:hypothetical protein
MATNSQIFGINQFLYLKGATASKALMKLVLGCTSLDEGDSATAVETATQTNGGGTGAEYGFRKNTLSINCKGYHYLSGDVTSLVTIADFRTAQAARTKMTLCWGEAVLTSDVPVITTGAVFRQATVVVQDIKQGHKIDDQTTFDVTFSVDGLISSLTTIA